MFYNGRGNRIGQNCCICLAVLLLSCGRSDTMRAGEPVPQRNNAVAAVRDSPIVDEKETGGAVSAQTTPESAAFKHLVSPFGDKVKKGRAIPGKAEGELVLLLGEGDRKFDLLLPLSDRSRCAKSVELNSARKAEQAVFWWLFEGRETVVLRLSRTSATYFRYSAKKACLVAGTMWDAALKEKGAAVQYVWTLTADELPVVNDGLPDGLPPEQLAGRYFLDKYSPEAGIKDPIHKELPLDRSGDILAMDFSTTAVRIFDANNNEMLLHPHVSAVPDGGLYMLFRITVMQNRNKVRFVKIEENAPGWGSDIDGSQLAYTVYEFASGNKTVKVAEHRHVADWWGKSWTSNGEDNKRMIRYYVTPFGIVRHEVKKTLDTETLHSDDIPSYVDEETAKTFSQRCPPKPGNACQYDYQSDKRITTWRFESKTKETATLFEEDWSAKTIEKVTYIPIE